MIKKYSGIHEQRGVMRLLRFSKKIAQPKILVNNCELDLSWASGPGFKGGP